MDAFLTHLEQWFTFDRVVMLWYIFNCVVQALPNPDASSGKFYRFYYAFAHTVAGNIALVRSQLGRTTPLPSDESKP